MLRFLGSLYGLVKNGFDKHSNVTATLERDPYEIVKRYEEKGDLSILPILVNELSDSDPDVRCEAAECINSIAQFFRFASILTKITEKAAPALERMLFSDPVDENRWHAACALSKLSLSDRKRSLLFTRTLTDHYYMVRAVSLITFIKMGDKAAPAANAVAALVGDRAGDGENDRYAIEIMALIGDDVAIRALRKAGAKGNKRAKGIASLLEEGHHKDFNFFCRASRQRKHELVEVLKILGRDSI